MDTTQLIVGIFTALGGLVLEYIRRERKSAVREWRETILTPYVVEAWHGIAEKDRNLAKIQGMGVALARRSTFGVVRGLPPTIIMDMVTVALGTVPGVGQSGSVSTGGK